MKTRQPGFVLLGVFLLLTLATVMVTQIYYKGGLYNVFVPVALQRERAKQLAQSGIVLAMNQLALHDDAITPLDDGSDKKKQQNPTDPEWRTKQLLKLLLTVQNRWQIFEFEQERDGLEGTLQICITCEDGKIPLGSLIDKKTGQFKKEFAQDCNTQTFLQEFFSGSKNFLQKKDLFPDLQEYLNRQHYRLIDITQVLTFEKFKTLSDQVFFEPTDKKGQQQFVGKAYWADLCTLWNEESTINPLLFSPSIRVVMKMGDQKPLSQNQIDELVKKIPVKEMNWGKEWDSVLKPVYGQDYKSLPKEFKALLSSKFEPRVFSVLCYGKVGKIGQKLLAIVARTFDESGEVFEVKKVYWL